MNDFNEYDDYDIEGEKTYCKWFARIAFVLCAVFWGAIIAWMI